MKPLILAGALGLAASGPAAGADFKPLFNGRDLTGWTNVNCAPETWSARNGLIYCTGQPIGALRTLRQYENFILELEWCHLTSGGNSGIFIWASPVAAPGVPFLRGIEVQVLDHGYNAKGKNEWYTTHGDVFPIHGATMSPFGRHNGMRSFPAEERSKGSPEWNFYRIVCTNGVLRLSVNGKEVSGGENCNYRKGYIGLESEGAPVEFRNIRLMELPPGNAAAEVAAPADPGWASLFNGLDWRGWRTNAQTAAHWRIEPNHLKSMAAKGSSEVTTEAEFADGELQLDCRSIKPGAAPKAIPARVSWRGFDWLLTLPPDGQPARYSIEFAKGHGTLKCNDQAQVTGVEKRPATRSPRSAGSDGKADSAKGPISLSSDGNADFMNLYFRAE